MMRTEKSSSLFVLILFASFKEGTHIFLLKYSSLLGCYALSLGKFPTFQKCRSSFIFRVKQECIYLNRLGLRMSVVMVSFADFRIQNPAVHSVREGL